MPRALSPQHPFARRAQQLYSLPAVALEVLELTSQPQVDMRAVKRSIENDPALTTKVLRVVNSSLFGLSCEVVDLNQALALLGIKPLKLLVLGFSLSEKLFSRLTGKVVSRYWRHTLTKAVAAREISQSVWNLPGDEPFLTALLQDLGMLVLVQELGDPYARFVEKILDIKGDVKTLEVQALGFDHRALTVQLLTGWGMPPSLVAAVDSRPDDAADSTLSPRERALPRIVHLAELLADLLVDARYEVLSDLLDSAMHDHNLSHNQLAELVERLQGKVDQLADVLALELPHGMDYRDVLVEAHSRLARLAAEVAGDLLSPTRQSSEELEISLLWNETHDLTKAVAAFDARINASPRGYSEPIAAPAPPSSLTAHDDRFDLESSHDDRDLADAQRSALETNGAASAHVEVAIKACRQARSPLTLLLVEIDRFNQIALSLGPLEAEHKVTLMAEACRALDVAGKTALQVAQARFALVLPGCDRSQAVQIGNHLLRAMRRVLAIDGHAPAASASVGVATVPLPAKNFRAAQLLESAARCLYAAQLSGGNTLKSIGIY